MVKVVRVISNIAVVKVVTVFRAMTMVKVVTVIKTRGIYGKGTAQPSHLA